MNKWEPDADPHQARRIGKTLEELGELSAVLARISIQGLDAIDPASGLTNRERMFKETADVIAQLKCNTETFGMDLAALEERVNTKIAFMAQWEAHFLSASTPPKDCQYCGESSPGCCGLFSEDGPACEWNQNKGAWL